MLKCIAILFVVILTSFFFFPFEFRALPGINTKMAMAAVGLCVYLIRLGLGKSGMFNKDTVVLSLIALGVSFISFISVIYNNTSDYAYVTYLVSMWVWIGAAYLLICCIRSVHGGIFVQLIGNYLITVCVLQCIMALLIDSSPVIKQVVDSYINQGHEFFDEVHRLYGIGAALDVAGSRFASVLIIIAFCMAEANDTKYRKKLWLYLGAFVWIGIVGNMIARTTTVGLILAVFYLIYKTKIYTFRVLSKYRRLWVGCGCIFVLAIPIVVYLYEANPNFQMNLRFAFEGFFSLVEEGRWEVSSNEKLKGMYVFPEMFKTWVIGDGYFENPISTDPYFTGIERAGFYMGTDVGYLRFIFYFGLIGLLAMSGVIYKAFQICWKRFPAQKVLFLLLMFVNFIVWFKVSTDIFLVFAPFLMIDKKENDAYMERIALKES